MKSLSAHTLIIHVIRTNKIPFIQSCASWPLIVTSVIIVAAGAWLIVPLPGEHARICLAPGDVLAVSGRHAVGLCDSDTGGENLVYSQVL
jgi:hypothetical protein